MPIVKRGTGFRPIVLKFGKKNFFDRAWKRAGPQIKSFFRTLAPVLHYGLQFAGNSLLNQMKLSDEQKSKGQKVISAVSDPKLLLGIADAAGQTLDSTYEKRRQRRKAKKKDEEDEAYPAIEPPTVEEQLQEAMGRAGVEATEPEQTGFGLRSKRGQIKFNEKQRTAIKGLAARASGSRNS